MRKLFTLVFLAVLVAGSWFFGSRLYALYDLREAATSGDPAALEDRVDFPALRESLKAEIGDDLDERGIGGLGGVLAKAGTALAVDEAINAETVAAIVRSGKAAGVTLATREDDREPVQWRIEGGDLHRFRVVGEGGGGALIFRRDGLGWRLAGIDLDGQ